MHLLVKINALVVHFQCCIQFENNDEILEVIKRIFVKDYEKTRLHFKAAISEGYFEPNTKAGFYTESDIQRTMNYIKDESIN